MRTARRRALFALVVIVIGGGVFLAVHVLSGPSLTPAQLAARAAQARFRALTAAEKRDVHKAEKSLSIALPTKLGAPAPNVPAKLFKTPLAPHDVVAFVPYYTLGELSPADFADTTTLSYFGLQIVKGGGLESPPQFIDLSSAPFASFVSSAHSARDQVVLTISAFSKSVIDSIARHPSTTAATLDSEVAPLVATYGLQGVDLDIEGRWSADRAGFTEFVRDFAAAFRSGDPSRMIIVDAFPQSASDAHDFFNLKKLAPVVNEFFIMAYAMESPNNASANSPIISRALGLSDVQSLIQFTKIVPAKKLVLGLPFYGYDFPTVSDDPGTTAATPDPEAVTYDAIAIAAHPAYWDPESETPYSDFQEGTQWHQTWFENPLSVALKAALASEFHTAGTGVWALGMEGGDTQMLDAIDGDSSPVKEFGAASLSAPQGSS